MFLRERETVRCAIPFLSVLETSLGRFRLESGAASRATRKSRERRRQSRTATYLSIACRSQEKGSVLHTRRWSFKKKKKKSLSTNRISKLDRNVGFLEFRRTPTPSWRRHFGAAARRRVLEPLFQIGKPFRRNYSVRHRIISDHRSAELNGQITSDEENNTRIR